MEGQRAISPDQDETTLATDNTFSGIVLRPKSNNIISSPLTIVPCFFTGKPVSVAQQD